MITGQNDSVEDRRQISVDAVAQFVALIHAREVGKQQAATEAKHRLDRLGVMVAFQQSMKIENGNAHE